MAMKHGVVNVRTYPPKTQYEVLDIRMTYAERRRIIFAVAMILVYLALMLSDFVQIISMEEQSA